MVNVVSLYKSLQTKTPVDNRVQPRSIDRNPPQLITVYCTEENIFEQKDLSNILKTRKIVWWKETIRTWQTQIF